MIYVPHDFDATHEYWTRLLKELPPDASPRLIERVTDARDKSVNWASQLPGRGAVAAGTVESWFKLEAPVGSSLVYNKLEGPWAKGLNPASVALPNRSSLKLENERLLLSGDGKPIAMDWEHHNRSRVLVVANGAYLLNEPVTDPSRFPLTSRVADWISSRDVNDLDNVDPGNRVTRRIAFVEGMYVAVAHPKEQKDDYRLEIQLGLLGLAACLAGGAEAGPSASGTRVRSGSPGRASGSPRHVAGANREGFRGPRNARNLSPLAVPRGSSPRLNSSAESQPQPPRAAPTQTL